MFNIFTCSLVKLHWPVQCSDGPLVVLWLILSESKVLSLEIMYVWVPYFSVD